MFYIEAYNSAVEEMNKHYFEQNPDRSFNYFMFCQRLEKPPVNQAMLDFLTTLDACKFYKAPKNKEDHKLDGCPENIKILWDAVKIACFLISLPELNCRDLLYHNIDFSLGKLYDLHSKFKDMLPVLNECLQSIVLALHPQSVESSSAGNEHRFFRQSKSESSLDSGLKPSVTHRPLTYT